MTEEYPWDTAPEKVPEVLEGLPVEPSDAFRHKAMAFAETARDSPINHSPSVAAASSVYLAGLMVNQKATQEEVCEASGVSDASLRQCYVKIGEASGLDMGLSKSGSEDETGSQPLHRRLLGRVLNHG